MHGSASTTSTGVQNTGAAYTAFSQKPAAQIVTNILVLDLLGSFNAPVNPGTNTNWLLNSMPMAALDNDGPGRDQSHRPVGAGFQAINMHVTGDVIDRLGQHVHAVHRRGADQRAGSCRAR